MLLVGIMFTVLLIRIFNLQIVKSDYYMENYIQKAEKGDGLDGRKIPS